MTQSLKRSYGSFSEQASSAGFTLIEGLIVAVVIGLLAAIAAPSFFGFWQQRKINATQGLIYQALRTAQGDAIQQRHDRRFSIRERNGQIEWASHSDSNLATQVAVWQPLVEGVVFADIDNTLAKSSNIYSVKFDMQGNVQGQLGTITVAMAGGKSTHRCVVVSTVLGAMRQGRGQTQANSNGRFCY